MVPIRMASISGFNGPRGSLFHGSATNTFGLGAPRPVMGKTRTAPEWYAYAGSEINQYDGLLLQARKIANKASREGLIKDYYGDPSDSDSAIYRRNSVAANKAEAEAYTPINYYIYDKSTVQGRVEKLNTWNKDFGAAVKYAEDTYGSLPEPVVIERIMTSTVSETPAWVLPVTIGAIGIALLAAFGVFGRK